MLSRDVKLVLTASFFYLMSVVMVTPLMTGFAEALHSGSFLMGIIGGLTYLCALFCRPIVGNINDRLSKYSLSTIGSLTLMAGSLGYVFSTGSLALFMSRLVAGFGYACCSCSMSTWLADLLPKEKIGSGMGLYGTVIALGNAFGPSLGVNITEALGYRAAFLLAAICPLVTLILIQFISDKGCPLNREQRGSCERKLQIVDLNVMPVAIIILLFTLPYFANQAFLLRYVSMFEIDVNVNVFFTTYAISVLVLRLAIKNLLDKYKYTFFVLWGCVSAFLSLYTLGLMKNNLALFAAGVFMAGGYGIMNSVCQSAAVLMAGPGKKGIATSTFYIGLDSGAFVGPLIGGMIYGSGNMEHFYTLLILTIPAILMVLVGIYRNNKTSLFGKKS